MRLPNNLFLAAVKSSSRGKKNFGRKYKYDHHENGET